MSSPIDYHSKLSDNWSNFYNSKRFNNRLVLFKNLIDHYVKCNQKWVDLGCGTGNLSKLMLDKNISLLCIDGSNSMLEIAKDKCNSLHCNFELKNLEFESIPFNSSYDGILSSSLIEYISNQERLFQNIADSLNKNGVLIISFPNKFSLIRNLQKLIHVIFKIFSIKKFEYLEFSKKSWTLSGFTKFMKINNLELVETKAYYVFNSILYFLNIPDIYICVFRKK
jgi:2-polyprenyl-3-methyl-5-hydroxy-6-metoxy-1,4-benzoquinol methylase